MARRRSSASRRSSSASSGARSPSARAPRARTDGKVDVQCPQCGAAYRVGQDMLDQKIECADCHRVFFAKSTPGRRVQKPDYTKAYVGLGIALHHR